MFADVYINARGLDQETGLMVNRTFNSTHRTLPLEAQWKRYLYDPEARALLAGFRIAPEVFGSIFEALEFAGVLSPTGNTTVYDAHLQVKRQSSRARSLLLPHIPFADALCSVCSILLAGSTR